MVCHWRTLGRWCCDWWGIRAADVATIPLHHATGQPDCGMVAAVSRSDRCAPQFCHRTCQPGVVDMALAK